MNKIISIDNINCEVGKKIFFDNFKLDIYEGNFITILGSCSIGKSLLAKVMYELINKNIKKNDKNKEKFYVGIIFEDIDSNFLCNNVYDNIVYHLKKQRFLKQDIENKVKKIVELLNIEYLLNRNIKTLSCGEKQLISLASILINNPKIVILDEAFSNIDLVSRQKIYTLLKKYNKENNMTIINITNDANDSLYGTNIAIINDHQVLINDKKESVYRNEKLFKESNIELPFLVDLSNKLKYYDLLEDIELDENRLVCKLWK